MSRGSLLLLAATSVVKFAPLSEAAGLSSRFRGVGYGSLAVSDEGKGILLRKQNAIDENACVHFLLPCKRSDFPEGGGSGGGGAGGRETERGSMKND